MALRKYSWPGNIRELSHAVERAFILSDRDELDTPEFQLSNDAPEERPVSLSLEASERRLVSEALEKAGGNISHAAAELGITRAALYRRKEKFKL
jgi:transcriptional regulator with PAS, ATPase and Fis domain